MTSLPKYGVLLTPKYGQKYKLGYVASLAISSTKSHLVALDSIQRGSNTNGANTAFPIPKPATVLARVVFVQLFM